MKPEGTTVNRGIRTFGKSHCCWFTTWVRYEAARNGAHPVEAKNQLQQSKSTTSQRYDSAQRDRSPGPPADETPSGQWQSLALHSTDASAS